MTPLKEPNFTFRFGGNTLSGFLDQPGGRAPSALVVLLPGHGPTDFASPGFAYYDSLRARFLRAGLSCFVWDKAGCGLSEGNYDHEQTIESAVAETQAAITALRQRGAAGSEHLGLWGISRAGWICPQVLQADPSIAFWISVSGSDHTDGSLHQLATGLKAEGKDDSLVADLVDRQRRANAVFWNGGPFDEFSALLGGLIDHPANRARFGKLDRAAYRRVQDQYVSGDYLASNGYAFDAEAGMIDMAPGFAGLLSSIDRPVLAIFGEGDTQVDWRRAKPFYEETIGSRPQADLTVKTFPTGDHTIVDVERSMQAGRMVPCDGYYDAMVDWLVAQGIGRP